LWHDESKTAAEAGFSKIITQHDAGQPNSHQTAITAAKLHAQAGVISICRG